MQATIQRELTRIHTPATMTGAGINPDAVHLMVHPFLPKKARDHLSDAGQPVACRPLLVPPTPAAAAADAGLNSKHAMHGS